MCTLYYYGASRVFNLSTLCGEIRQTLDAKMRQIFKVKKSVVFQLPCVQVVCVLYFVFLGGKCECPHGAVPGWPGLRTLLDIQGTEYNLSKEKLSK
jgi:hypothetical protein